MKRLLYLFILIVLAFVTRANTRPDTTVYFVDIYPGSEVYELEGHSAIVVEIDGRMPIAYNFGVFDFDAPNFIYRFVKGQTDYMAVPVPAEPFFNYYASQGRRVVAHRLDLSPEATQQLVDKLNFTIQPANRTYRYNYVKNNCATRPLSLVESVVGEQFELGASPASARREGPSTFRDIMRHYHRNYPWYQFGIDLALGSGIDYPLADREAAFAPVELDEMIARATVGDKPLVAESIVVVEGTPDATLGPTPWYLTPMSVFTVLLALAIVLSINDIRRRRLSRWFDTVFYAALGITGCLLTFLIFVSEHEATSPNFLYIWINPLCLLPAVLIWIKKAKTFLVWLQITNFVALLAFSALWALLPQSFNAAMLPILAIDMLRSATYILTYRAGKLKPEK